MVVLYILVALCAVFTIDAGTLRCRLCNRAATLSDCNKVVTCDDTLEECYMDELVTDQLTLVYDGGCRAKDVCSYSGRKKRGELMACSRCCAIGDDCNTRLCSIPDDTINSTQCYSCDHRSPSQSSISNPDQCVTLKTCESNEVCFTQEESKGSFYYGCQRKAMCSILMQRVFHQMDACISHPATCGGIKRSTTLCNSCCGSGGCNFGNCLEQNYRLYRLWKKGLFDIHTLKQSG